MPPAFHAHGHGDSRWITFPALEGFPFLEHGFTLRPFRAQAFHRTGLLDRLRSAAGMAATRLARTDQIHSADVAPAEADRTFPRTDGLLTAEAGLALAAYSGDCLLIYLVDPIRRVAGIVHAGRKGTQSRIAEAAVRLLASRFGSDPEDCLALFSPAIGPCCYEINLEEENARQLRGLGLARIVPARTCTKCRSELFYSYRRGEKEDRMVGWIGIRTQEAISIR